MEIPLVPVPVAEAAHAPPVQPPAPPPTPQQPQPQPDELLDYANIKQLLSEAELEAQQQGLNLQSHEAALLAARERHALAKAAFDESVLRVERLKSRFREQIMDEGLRQSCRWNDMYYKLVEWKNDHNGDTTVPCDPKSSEEVKKLNRWVINQRTAYKYFMNGDRKHIKDHRIDALNKIGFVWSVTDQLWEKNFEDLRRHHAAHGSFEVTHKQNRKLATFVSRLRTAMNHKKHGLVQQELTQEKIDRLNSINFVWKMKRKQRKSATRDTVKFDVMYGHLVAFKEIYGHLKVNKMEKEWKKGISRPEKKVFRRLPLFLAFCRKEQLLYVEGQPCSLDEDKVRLLTELGVAWKKPASEPRKSTGGEATRKRKKGAAAVGGDAAVVAAAADVGAPGVAYQCPDADRFPPPHGEAGVPIDAAAAAAAAEAAELMAAAVAADSAAAGHPDLATIPPPPMLKTDEGTLI